MIRNFKNLARSKFLRNVVIVATGTAGAQAIAMAFAPIITRLYGPEAFGLLGSFVAILSVLTPMAALTYPIAIVLPAKDEDARGLAALSILLAIGISLITLALLLVWGDWVAFTLGIDAVSNYLWLVSLAMLFAAFHQVLEQWLIRHHKFRLTARVAVLQSLILNGAKAGGGVFYPLAPALIILQTLASGMHFLLLWGGIRRTQPLRLDITSLTSLMSLAKKYRDFPLFRAPEVTINAASQGLPVLMLAALSGPSSAGFYTLARTIMGIPAGLLGKSVGDVFYPRISQATNNRESISPLVWKATMLLAAVGVLPFTVVLVFGPWLFSFVFGSEWTVAGDYARWIALWLFFLFINNPSVKAIPIIRAQGFQLLYTILTLVVRLLALFIAYYFYESDVAAIMVFSIVSALANVYLILYVLHRCKRFDAGLVHG